MDLPTPEVCFNLLATPSGFIVFTASLTKSSFPIPPWSPSLLILDPSGQVVDMKPALLPPSRLLGSAQFKDGSWLVGWTEDSASAIVQHFSATGDALSSPHPLSGSLSLASPAEPLRFEFTITGLGLIRPRRLLDPVRRGRR